MLKQSDSRKGLLNLIKRNGELTLNQAAEWTGLSRTTLREHFTNLEYEGYLQRSTKREGRGRPELVFKLTETGHKLFPSGDGLLLRSLLYYLNEHGNDELLSAFFEDFWQKRKDEIQRRLASLHPPTLEAKSRILREFLEEQGFMPDIHIEGTDTIVIKECNCPFTDAVKETHLPCKLEARFLQEFFSSTLERVAYIPDGSHACMYHLKLGDDHPVDQFPAPVLPEE